MAQNATIEPVRILSELVAAVATMSLYPSNHPQVTPLIERLYNSIAGVFYEVPELTFFVVDDDIVARGKPLLDAGPAGKSFLRILNKNQIERVTFITGMPKSQLVHFVRDLASGDAKSSLSKSCIKLGKVSFAVPPDTSHEASRKQSRTDEEVAALLFFRELQIEKLKKLYHGIKDNRSIDIDEAAELVSDFVKKFKREMNPLSLLASLKTADEYTYVHATNVALLTMSLAEYLGFSGDTLHDVGVAALLHDVGKMVTPDEILNKRGALSDDERAVMQNHTLQGAQYLIKQKNVKKLTLLAALEHHIKYDGTGYPHIKGKWQPNIVSQMISIADVFDALRSKRPYREPLQQEKITGILLKDSGTAFNPVLIQHFLFMIEQ